MKKRILIEVFIPILSLRFLMEVTLSLKNRRNERNDI